MTAYRLTTTKRYTFCSTCQSDVGVTTNGFGRSSDGDVVWVTSRHKDAEKRWCSGSRVTISEAVIFTADRPVRAGTAT